MSKGLKEIGMVVDMIDFRESIENINIAMEGLEDNRETLIKRAKEQKGELLESLKRPFRAYRTDGMNIKPGVLDMLKGMTNPFN